MIPPIDEAKKGDDFQIEDYFGEDKISEIAKECIDNHSRINKLPKDLKNKVKEKLKEYCKI